LGYNYTQSTHLRVAAGKEDDMPETNQIGQIVQGILDSYHRDGGINYASGLNLPSQQHIIDIILTLRMILFPGYYTDRAVEDESLPYTTGERVVWVYKHLREEVTKSICFVCSDCNANEACIDCNTRSNNITLALLREIPNLRRKLKLDVQAAVDGDPAAGSSDEVILAYPSLLAITVHRVAHFLYKQSVPLLPRIMSEYIHHRTGIDIHPGATIGDSFFIDHGTGVVIGETTLIGNRAKLYQGVTLGAMSVARTMRGHKRHPTIEDDVTIYAGASILGGETVIGKGSVIGGNVWLVSSVPPYSKVYNTRSSMEPVVKNNGSTQEL
jgi:serine O-acetyltransferase